MVKKKETQQVQLKTSCTYFIRNGQEWLYDFIMKDFYTPVNVITYNVVLNYYGETWRTFSL